MTKSNTNKKFSAGFTLIELMAVILIIVILATIGLVSYSRATRSARDGKRKSDIEAIRQAMILYRQDNASYPAAVSTLVSQSYLSAPEPVDPQSGTSYNVVAAANTFCVCAGVEILDSNGNNTTNANCNSLTAPSASTDFYCARQP